MASAPRWLGAALLAALALAAAAAEEAEAGGGAEFYPCRTCHAALNLTGDRKAVPFHGIDLTEGAHAGLVCSSCHVAPLMEELVGGVEVRIPGLHSQEELVELYRVCQTCHARVVEDYLLLVHGNKTMRCPGGESVKVRGYKGVVYDFYVCPEYRNFETVPARACVQCHNPHNPTMPALEPLPLPSTRPPAPEQPGMVVGMTSA